MTFKKTLTASAMAIAAVCAPVANAAVYSLTSQDVTFAINTIDADSLGLTITNAPNATGNWGPATTLSGFSLGDLGLNFNSVGGAAYYLPIGSGSSFGVIGTLSGSGSTPCGNGNATGQMCFDFSPNLTLANSMAFQIDFTSAYTIGATGPDLKVAFANDRGNTIGDLLSKNLPLSSSSGSVPEPNSSALVLLGLGLLGVSFATRRRRSDQA